MSSLTIRFLMSLILILGTTLAHADRFHPSHLFIKMKKDSPLIKSTLILSSKQMISNLYLVETTNVEALAYSLKQNKNVEYVQKDYFAGQAPMPKLEPLDLLSPKLKIFMSPSMDFGTFNDPQVPQLWAFSGKYGIDVLDAYMALPTQTPEEVIVAVVDTGVDHNHEDLKDIMWINHTEIPNDQIDNDGNGYIDDVHGINVVVRDTNGRATSNTMASHWHGTHVAGTIAATQNNGIGIAGVANNVKIMALRTVPDDSDELDSNIVEALTYAAKNGARIINCSFGKKANEGGMVVRDVITEIGKKHNVLVVVSAGNDSKGPFNWYDNDITPKYPASFDSENMLVVAATDQAGSLANFSNIGTKTVDVAAPGVSILSTTPNNGYAMANGTSMATPNTAGAAAMILGYNPKFSALQVKKALTSSVSKVANLKGKMTSGGRVNLANAIKKLHIKQY